MRTRLRSLHRNQRGQIMIFGMLTILFVLVVGGLATDYAHLFLVDDELEKSMDAAALAAAGKLGFNDTVFPVARAFAREFAERNAYRAKGSTGEVALDNDGNAGDAWQSWDSRPHSTPYGEITLGVWDPALPQGIGPNLRFAPSTDGTIVNAVMCRYKSQLPTTLFGVWGHRFFNVSATSIATSNPPQTPPPDG